MAGLTGLSFLHMWQTLAAWLAAFLGEPRALRAPPPDPDTPTPPQLQALHVTHPAERPAPDTWDDTNVTQQYARYRLIRQLLYHKRLPAELTHYICTLADEALVRDITTSCETQFWDNADVVYLRTPPLDSALVRHFLCSVTVDTDSHDQGWSSDPNRDWHGTYQGSYTWWELALERPSGEEVLRQRLCTNVHASLEYKRHSIVLGAENPLLQEARARDMLALRARTQFPGWVNFARYARIRVRFDWGAIAEVHV